LNIFASLYQFTLRKSLKNIAAPVCICNVADRIELMCKGLVKDKTQRLAEILKIEGLKISLYFRISKGKLNITVRTLYRKALIDRALVLTIVVNAGISVFLDCATRYDIVDSIIVHEGKADLLI
jgi:hypothetical protein